MHVSLTVLRKGTRSITIQGMVHIGSKQFYEDVQSQLDTAVARGHRVFVEGIRVEEQGKTVFTREAQDIYSLFEFILSLYPASARRFGFVEQDGHIRYPKSAVNADVAFHELVLLLDAYGFRAHWMLRLLRQFPKKLLVKELSKPTLPEQKDVRLGWFSRRMLWLFFFRKIMSVLVHYRDRVAVATIMKYAPKQNAIVHYGDEHAPGIIRLLRKEGWVVRSVEYIDAHKK
jgi:hypothetical protein